MNGIKRVDVRGATALASGRREPGQDGKAASTNAPTKGEVTQSYVTRRTAP